VNLAITNCRRLPIPLPPVNEQHRIVAEADRLLSITTEIELDTERQLSLLGRLRQSILNWAFEGRLVDQDPADEPAAKLLERIKADRDATGAAPRRRRKASS
jgi:type I restriction enzyme S subunit